MPSNRTIRPPRPLIPGRHLDVNLGGLDPDMEYVYQELKRLSDLAAQIGPITLPTAGYSANDLLVFVGGAWTAISKFDLLALTDLTDVALTGPTTNQVLLYTGGQWVNQTLAGVIALNDLSDVTVNLGVDGDLLVRDGTGEWTAANWTTRALGIGAAPTLAKFEINLGSASDRGIVVRGTTAQTAALLQLRSVTDVMTLEVGVGTFGVFAATPVGKQGSTTDLKDVAVNFGFLTDGGATPLNTDGGQVICGALQAAGVTKTANYTAAGTDCTIFGNAAGGAFQITLPSAAGRTGRIYRIKKIDASANAVTVGTTGGETIDGAATVVLAAQFANVVTVSDGTNWSVF